MVAGFSHDQVTDGDFLPLPAIAHVLRLAVRLSLYPIVHGFCDCVFVVMWSSAHEGSLADGLALVREHDALDTATFSQKVNV